jgi:NAD-dependent dihydropyrimidine dehydrogenase PreA subunit
MPKVTVDQKKCIGCGACADVCPVGVFSIEGGKANPKNQSKCIACHACEGSCPVTAIIVED